MPSTTEIATPVPVPAPRRQQHAMPTLITSPEQLFASLNATLASKMASANGDSDLLATPVHHIQEHDYSVPAPPPPSPVSFNQHHVQWGAPQRC
ncbi:uncharacterized protein CTHT_0051780 [Thermochaetoides thermophila DSM 1495]|uniref:Uncharacterized protein n=1 Tax=Chaetomium thermophilum (strain DSM 1495 / CBS 144.50 / IMI 039719) TaxID=759272 RepID=G0SDH3_CHATD|nr:hypothetical protein CTHT_0051780 [Thermochaetoides thermophila DSM 1495]EGS18574.1 hypothetical protein CTHT_0051780 [Thermochaetoides thermophila DSM 1495]